MWSILPWTFSRQRGTKNHLFILCCLQPSVSEALRFFFCSDLKQVYRLVSSVFVLIFWCQIVCTYKSRESPVNDMYEVVQCRLCWILRSYIVTRNADFGFLYLSGTTESFNIRSRGRCENITVVFSLLFSGFCLVVWRCRLLTTLIH